MKLTDLLKKVAKVTGNDGDEGIQALLANEVLAIDIDDDIETKLIGGLYTKEAAKNDREIQDFYYEKIEKGIYDKVDDVVLNQFKEFGIDDSVKEEVTALDSPMKRLKGLMKAAKDKKPAAKVDNTEIEKLHVQIKELNEAHNLDISEIKEKQKQETINFLGKNKVFSHKLVDNIPGGKNFLADATINKLSKDYHLNINDNQEIEVKTKADPSMDVFVDNEKVSFDALLLKELDPFIKRNDDPPKPGPSRKPSVQADDKPMTFHQRVRSSGVNTSL
jgi:hypothetical protein